MLDQYRPLLDFAYGTPSSPNDKHRIFDCFTPTIRTPRGTIDRVVESAESTVRTLRRGNEKLLVAFIRVDRSGNVLEILIDRRNWQR